LIAIDTSSLRRYLEGKRGVDTQAVVRAVGTEIAILPPIVLTEALSDWSLSSAAIEFTRSLPLIELQEGYWVRAGLLRARLRSSGLKAATPDCLIAQACIDQRIPLITYDRDFRRFVPAGLKLAIEEG